MKLTRQIWLVILALVAAITVAGAPASAQQQLEGQVLLAGEPIAGAAVTLWTAGADAPAQLAQAQTGADGRFALSAPAGNNATVYLVAKGGTPRAVANQVLPNKAITLMVLLGNPLPGAVTVNELTTVASAFAAAQFIKGESISGNPLGLRIAAGNVPNMVDPGTGKWGKVLLDPLNSTQTTTLANLDTLGSLVTAFATVATDDWRARFLKAATLPDGTTPKDTVDAMASIARQPWAQPKELFALFDEAYPQPKDGARREAPFVPYLAYAPDDFVLSLCFAGGGVYSAGRLMFDAEGNLWSGQNWMAGSQSGVNQSIGGGVVKLSPNGTALSPPITGFTGMGIDGVGWGTAVTKDKVWTTSFDGKILVLDFNGRPIGTESDFPFKEKFLGLMGVGVAANGDVWIADGSDNQLLHFPGGRVKDGRIVKVAGLKSPFDIVIDAQNRVWVSNSQSDKVVRFPADDPSKAESFRAGIGVRALALDSKGNVWVASNMSLDFPPPVIPDGASIMAQFKIAAGHMLKVLETNPNMVTGVVNMIRPDGSQPAPTGFTGNKAVSVPWGLNIDGNDDVWIGNFWGRGVVLMAGDNTKGHPAGTKTGDVIHVFKGGSIQMLTDVSIDPAGNVWAANNWNDLNGAASPDPARPTSTWGGGSGITVIYGVAAPVQPPRMGMVRKP
jgi:ethanolamine utilization protein EutQ (cupin superfamily)